MWWWIVLGVWLALVVLWVFSMVDIMRSDPDDWDDVTPSRSTWFLTVLLVGWITSIGYLLLVRPVVRAGAARRIAGEQSASMGPGALKS